MAIDRDDIKRIIEGVVGVGVAGIAGVGIAKLIDMVIDNGTPYESTYSDNNTNSDDEDYENIPSADEVFEADRIQREMVSMWDEHQTESMWDDYLNGTLEQEHVQEQVQKEIHNDIASAQREFDRQSSKREKEYIYIDFTHNLRSGSRNRNDVYQESIEEQFEKVQRKLASYGRNDSFDLKKIVSLCFPTIKSTYYVSLPSFDRRIEASGNYQGAECIYNMVLRSENTGTVSYVIPEELDIVLIGDLVFRNGIISFVVKGMDLIDKNVEKFGELRIECAAACAVIKNRKNLPDYGIGASELYKPFLTRDTVLELCNNVYPIENPEKAIRVFEEWLKYVDFRSYFLEVQSQRNEAVDDVSFMKAYSVSRSEYRKNEDLYSQHLLDNKKCFIQKDHVLLDEPTEDSVEFPLMKIEISRNLAELNRRMVKGKPISEYERVLRRFTRIQVALSKRNPEDGDAISGHDVLMYLGERIAFEVEDIEPDCNDINEFFNNQLSRIIKKIDEKYEGIINMSIDAYRDEQEQKLEKISQQETQEFFNTLDRNLESDIKKNNDKSIEKRYLAKVKEIRDKYQRQKKQLERTFYNKLKEKNADEQREKLKLEVEKLEIAQVKEIENIPLESWYVDRNENWKADFKKNRESQKSRDLENICSEKERLLKVELGATIQKEKEEYKTNVEKERQKEIAKMNREHTERHFYVYFKAEDIDVDSIKSEELSDFRYLVYDNRAEKAKIDRQRKTLNSFYQGYVKNPFLASYLFVPETLGKSESEQGEIEWFGNRLNDSQKEAVRKALASNSLFLLQGPPGTGKTEVIAEITAQYVKQGKKVLVSSETHKAIDNVFERLPKIPEIRPLRLVPSMSNKETEYSPEKLVDNLYLSISSRLDKRIRQYENITEMKNKFSEKMGELRFRYSQLLAIEWECKDIQNEKKKLQKEIELKNAAVEEKRSAMSPLDEEKSQYSSLLRNIEKGNFRDDVDKSDILIEMEKHLFEMLSKYDFWGELDSETIQKIYCLDLEQVREEFKAIEENGSGMSVEQEKASIRAKIRALRDPDTDEIIEGKEDEYETLRKQLIALKNAKDVESNIDYSALYVSSMISADKLADSMSRARILQELVEVRSSISEYSNERKSAINSIIEKLEEKIIDIDSEIANTKSERNQLLASIEQINDNDAYMNFRTKKQELRKTIVNFFTDFDITDEYPADDFATALDIISNRWNEIERNQDNFIQESQSRIPMYKNIRNYLSDEEILEEDRISYTKKLFDSANVFGMTCTSREYFSESSMKSLREYKLGNINVRNVGIDVVIIDEVSKSSFLDLLIPVLYGKTVILVGDHRQLPPIYDLKHMKKADFDGLDEEIIDYDINKHYQEMYENCFFKELFEKVPDSYRIMLDKQYRCHSDIMDVFNHFYSANGKGLSVGLKNQNDLKQHNLTIKSKGVTIIEPQNHIYFVNCTEKESHLDNESSSFINRQEAEVTCQLLKLINEQYGRMIKSDEVRYDVKRDERKSIGVICTYRDQARHIRNSIKGQKYPNISQRREEKLIINTVDDFQGDERDIIIVSMVRNPRGDRYSTEFIDQFERINVALSRARCMLIIVGSQEFLSRSSINLPDINGRKELDRYSFPVYKEIIRTIQAKGKVLQATDIIGEVEKDGK